MRHIIALVVLATAVNACPLDALWAACQRDNVCAFLYNHTGRTGVADAVAYHATMAANNRPVSYMPRDSAVSVSVFTIDDPNATCAQPQIDALVRHGAFWASATTTCLPGESVAWDPTIKRYVCLCQPGHRCGASADAFSAAGVAPVPLSVPAQLAIGAAIVVLALSLALAVLVVWWLWKTRGALTLLLASRELQLLPRTRDD